MQIVLDNSIRINKTPTKNKREIDDPKYTQIAEASQHGTNHSVFLCTQMIGYIKDKIWARVMVLSSTFNNISVISGRSILLVEETGVPGENQRPATRLTDKLYHIMLY